MKRKSKASTHPSNFLLSSEQEERRQIASELYNSTSQKLTALRFTLRVIEKSWGRQTTDVRAALAECLRLAEQCDRELLASSRSLYPPILDEFGLAPALRSYLAELRQHSGIRAKLVLDAHLQHAELPCLVELTLYRATEEALATIRNYSPCKVAQVELSRRGSQKQVVLRVRSLGSAISDSVISAIQAGCPPSGARGLSEIVERVRQMRGRCSVEAAARGTIVTVIVPVPWRTVSLQRTEKNRRQRECPPEVL